jgi:hypothetical protein
MAGIAASTIMRFKKGGTGPKKDSHPFNISSFLFGFKTDNIPA